MSKMQGKAAMAIGALYVGFVGWSLYGVLMILHHLWATHAPVGEGGAPTRVQMRGDPPLYGLSLIHI